MSDQPRPAPREVVVASAGAGKTYRLSQRIIELLDRGDPPEEILASTFTRKAAGEILDRVLLRLAQGAADPEEAGRLELSQERCLSLLTGLVRRLHAVNVGTLDSFFQRVARGFSLELGLPVRWTLSDGPAEARLRSEAVSRLLDEADRGVAVELVRLLQGGRARAGVLDLLLTQVADLHGLYRELDPDAEAPWGFPLGEREAGPRVTEAELAEAARAVAEAPVPLTGAGNPHQGWAKGRNKAAVALGEGDLEGFLDQGIVTRVLTGETYYGSPFPEALTDALQAGLELVRRELAPRIQARADAMARLLPLYDRWITRLRRRTGLYQFDDVTRLLAAGLEAGAGAALHYRLDARIRHVLLDEFQDTSLAQWWAVRPLVAEILSGYEGERGVVLVADPKQSIYGWRGGEPRLLEAVERDFHIPGASLHESWRSAPVVLDFVNRVFGSLEGTTVLEEGDRGTAAAWLSHFTPHESAPPLRERPGHVKVEVGPAGDSPRASVRPRLLAAAARRAAQIHRACPGATVGILTRTNSAVTRLMGELRRLGVDASEEGGVPVADSPAVLSLLALLRMADHPADRAARYQVAHTPVRALAPDLDWDQDDSAARTAAAVRRRLAREGYGPVVAGWVRKLEGRASPRDRRRLRQLAELAFRWAERATLRPGDFVRWVAEERVEDPAAAAVRVMTVHQAKGLQFDVVLLPDLEWAVQGRGGGTVHAYRESPDAPVSRVYPAVRSSHLELFEAMAPAAAQAREARVRDGLSVLYVALTRARFGLHLFLAPDPESGRSSASSAARLVRAAVGRTDRITEGEVLMEEGDPAWWTGAGAPRALREGAPAPAPAPAPVEVPAELPAEPPAGPLLRPRPAGKRTRLLARRSPSDLEGGGTVRLEHVLRDRGGPAREEGTLVHEWLRHMEWVGPWLDGSGPDRDGLRRIAREAAPGVRDPEAVLDRLLGWLEAPAVREALDREAYPAGARVERERAFLVRERDRVIQGVVDRVVVAADPEGEGPRAWILDYKTDRFPADARAEARTGVLAARIAHYRPQMEAYRRAVAREEGIALERVQAALVFLRIGQVAR